MNNKGQSLIMFVLLLPLIALVVAFFIDSSLSMMEKNKIDGIITNNMQISLDKDIKDIEKITNAIKKNGNINVFVSIVDDNLHIKVESTKKSLFAKLLKIDSYNLNFNYCGNYQDKKINKKCG